MKRNRRIATFLSPKKTSNKIILSLLFIISTVLLFLPVFFDVNLKGFMAFGVVGLLIINFLGSATLFMPAPSMFSVAVASASMNPLLVAGIASIASALGEGVAYVFGYSSTEMLNLKRHKGLYRLAQSVVHWRSGILIIPFAFFPNPFFDGLGILAGISKFPIVRFFLYTFLGRLLRNLGIAYSILYIWR